MKKQLGFSLIEFIIVIVILGILIGTSTLLLSQGFNSYLASEDLLDANSQGEIAMQRMARDIAMIRSPNDVTIAAANQLAFTDINNDDIMYSLSGTNLIITKNTVGQILARGVNSLTFLYYGADGNTPPTSNTGYVRIVLNITQNNVNYSLTTSVYARNLT